MASSQVTNYLQRVSHELEARNFSEIQNIRLELEKILFKNDFLKTSELLASVHGFKKPKLYRDVVAEQYIPSCLTNQFIALR